MNARPFLSAKIIAASAALPFMVHATDVSSDTSAATGSITARPRAVDVINAADYGVICDGSADNGSSFAAALAAAGARHVNLLVPAGVCASSKTVLNNYSGVTMIGAAAANSVDNVGSEAFVGTTIKYTGAPGGTMMVIGPVAISGADWTVHFDGRDSLQSQGLVGITLDCGGLATRGIYTANSADILIDARVYQPVNHTSGPTTYYATAMEVDANVNRGSISLSWYENVASAGPAGIRPINTYPSTFADGSGSYNYANPAAPYPIGVWFHSAFTQAVKSRGGITGGNPSYITMPKLISSNQNHGVPIQVDWADHLSFGLIDQYGAGSSLVGRAGMVINDSNLMWRSGTTSGDTPSGSHRMSLADVDWVNPNGQITLTNGGPGLPANNCLVTAVDYLSRTLSICGPAGTSADIPSGTPVTYLNDAAGLSPGGITIAEYASGAPLFVAGRTGTAFAAPQGVTINKYDIANGTPAPVIESGATVDWEDDLSAHHQFRVGGGNCLILSGSGSPAGVVSAPQCSLYLRSGGGPGFTLYVKEFGSGTAGWAAK